MGAAAEAIPRRGEFEEVDFESEKSLKGVVVRYGSKSRRGMNGESAQKLALVLVLLMLLGLLAVFALLAFLVGTDETVSQEQSRWGEPIGEMVVCLVDVTTGPLAF